MFTLTPLSLVRKIELALLAPQLSRKEVEEGCATAIQFDCVAVIVKPHYIEVARKALKDTHLKDASVVGFPHGNVTTAARMYEAQDILQRGAEEIVMVMNVGAWRDNDELVVRNDMTTVLRIARLHPVTLVLETPLLTDDEKVRACKIAGATGAEFVQTASGFSGTTTVQDIAILRAACPGMKIKAAGGIETQADALKMIESGASRLIVNDVQKILLG